MADKFLNIPWEYLSRVLPVSLWTSQRPTAKEDEHGTSYDMECIIVYLSQYLIGVADSIVQVSHLVECETSKMQKNNNIT